MRFQTDNDINKMVDSNSNRDRKSSSPPADNGNVHSMNTFKLRDGFVNTGYAANGTLEKRKLSETPMFVQTQPLPEKTSPGFLGIPPKSSDADRSERSSLNSATFFRTMSSVTLGSMENELTKAFESFRAESSEDEVEEVEEVEVVTQDGAEVEAHDLDMGVVVTNLSEMRETDLISVGSSETLDKTTPRQSRESLRMTSGESPQLTDPSPELLGHAPGGLVRRSRSSDNRGEQSEPSPPSHKKLTRSHSEQTSGVTRKTSEERANCKYSYIHDMDTKDGQDDWIDV